MNQNQKTMEEKQAEKKQNNIEQFLIRLFRILPIILVVGALLYSVVIMILLISPVWIVLSLLCYLLGNERYISLTYKTAFDFMDFVKSKIASFKNTNE